MERRLSVRGANSPCPASTRLLSYCLFTVGSELCHPVHLISLQVSVAKQGKVNAKDGELPGDMIQGGLK